VVLREFETAAQATIALPGCPIPITLTPDSGFGRISSFN
jgi:hypothetical protein